MLYVQIVWKVSRTLTIYVIARAPTDMACATRALHSKRACSATYQIEHRRSHTNEGRFRGTSVTSNHRPDVRDIRRDQISSSDIDGDTYLFYVGRSLRYY